MRNRQTYRKITFILLLCIICFSMKCNMPPREPANITYAKQLLAIESLAKHADYFKKEYENYTKDEPEWAYKAILTAELLNSQYKIYELYPAKIKEMKGKDMILVMGTAKGIFNVCLASYGEAWSAAIDRHVKYEYCSVDFSTVLAIYHKEFSRMDVFINLAALKDEIKNQIKDISKEKYPKTLELYSILSQLSSLAESPAGSLRSFTETVDDANNEYEKIKSLAELEY